MIPLSVNEYFQVTCSFCPLSVALGSTKTLTKVSTKEFAYGEVRPARRAHNSAVLVVSNVKVRLEAAHSIPPLSLHDLLRKRKSFLCRPSVNNFSETSLNM